MGVFRIMILCVAAAMVCAMLRTLHPQLAMVVALAAGVAALMFSVSYIESFAAAVRELDALMGEGGMEHMLLLKLCGVAVVSEFASDICRDAGESALAHRIDMAVKIVVIASALPLAAELMETVAELLA